MDEMEELLKRSAAVDKKCYQAAKTQATKLEEYLAEHDECRTMIIDLGEQIFTLDITHTDILNEIFCMLENLKTLEADYK